MSDCEGQLSPLVTSSSGDAEPSRSRRWSPRCHRWHIKAAVSCSLAALLLASRLKVNELVFGSVSSGIQQFSQSGYSWGRSDIKFTLLEPLSQSKCCRHLADDCCLDDNLICWDDPQDAMPPCCDVSITTHGLKPLQDVEDTDAVEGFFRERVAEGIDVKILVSASGSLEIQWSRGQLWFGLWNSSCHGYNWYDWISPDEFLRKRTEPYTPGNIWVENAQSLFLQFKSPFTSSNFHDCLVGPVFENCGKVQPCLTTTTTTTPDCHITYYDDVLQVQKDWCCLHKLKACPGDCSISFWDSNVVQKEKDWCCTHQHVACPPDCKVSFYDQSITMQEKNWCCASQGVGCAPECRISFYDASVSQQEKDWCCSNKQAACAPDCKISFFDVLATQQEKQWCCDNLNLACAPGCDISFFAVGVSQQQKDFCCSQHGVACAPNCDITVYDQAIPQQQKDWCCANKRTGCAPDCQISFYDTNVPQQQKDWCCTNKAVACAPGCQINFFDAAASQQQKQFCCSKYQVACVPDCNISFYDDAVSQREKDWCCANKQTACAPTCQISFYDTSITQQEKTWCCTNKQVACEPNCQITFFDASISQQQKDYCCSQHQLACAPDCNSGFLNWETAWSPLQQNWCCQHAGRGCPPDCDANFSTWQTSWSSDKKRWCCTNKGKGCQNVEPYDCEDGLDSSWTNAQNQYCCNKPLSPANNTKDCKIWGDPHFITFDGAQFVFFRTGIFWIIKSTLLLIQGQFENTLWTKQNDLTDFSSMTAMVISGPLAGGHKIEIRAFDHGGIYCDGKTILQTFGSSCCGGHKVTYSDQGALIDGAMGILPRRVVSITLKKGVTIQVNRFPNFMNALITSPAFSGLDGICGNFNGNADDEIGKITHNRFGSGVPTNELLFEKGINLYLPTARPNAKKCSLDNQKLAAKFCQNELISSPSWTMSECIGDSCGE